MKMTRSHFSKKSLHIKGKICAQVKQDSTVRGLEWSSFNSKFNEVNYISAAAYAYCYLVRLHGK